MTSDGDRHRLIFWASHAIADGSSMIFLFLRLLDLFTQFAQTGTAEERPAHPFPEPPHEVAASRVTVSGEPPYLERLTGTVWSGAMPSPAELTDIELGFAVSGRVRLDAETTARVRAYARSHGLTMHGVVAGAIAVAERHAFTALAPDATVPLGILTPVDVRPRLRPRVGVTEVTTLVGFSPARVEVSATSDPIEAGRQIAEQLAADLASGIPELTSVSPMPDPATRPYGPSLIVSSIGQLPTLALPESLSAEDLRTYIHKNFAGLADLVTGAPAGVVVPVPEATMYVVMTFQGELSIEARNTPGTVTADTQAAVLGVLRRVLSSLGEPAP